MPCAPAAKQMIAAEATSGGDWCKGTHRPIPAAAQKSIDNTASFTLFLYYLANQTRKGRYRNSLSRFEKYENVYGRYEFDVCPYIF